MITFAADAGLLKLAFEAVLTFLAIMVTQTDLSILTGLATQVYWVTLVTFATLIIVAVMDALTT